jgi:hypothetical protein
MSAFLGSEKNPVPDVLQMVFEHFDKVAHSNSYGNRVR